MFDFRSGRSRYDEFSFEFSWMRLVKMTRALSLLGEGHLTDLRFSFIK